MNQSKTGKLFCARAALWPLLAAAALVAACGGGGGGVPTPPTFEYVSINGVNGVRDNRTKMVWARSLGAVDGSKARNARYPSVAEMLRLVEGTDEADLQQYFGFAVNAVSAKFRAYDTNRVELAAQWSVDVGGYAVRGAVSAEPAADPTSEWFVLEPAAPTNVAVTYSPMFNRGVLTADAPSLGVSLMWKLCAEGSVWDNPSATCIGSPGVYNAAAAQQAADAANLAKSETFDGWRLPTKQELQSLLKLEASQRPLVQDLFFVTYDQTTPWGRAFRTSTTNVAGTWGVHFDTGEVYPSVQPSTQLHVRLVRTVR
jgi:hypothetical protein